MPAFRQAGATSGANDVKASVDELAAKIDAGEPLSDQDIATLGSSRDIIWLGMLATTVRRRLRGNEVTYVRVADLTAIGEGGRPADAAGEVRIFETPKTLDAAIAVVEKARDLAGDVPLSAFCLFELGKLSEGLPVVLTALRKAGLEIVTQAPHRSPHRSRARAGGAGRCGSAVGAIDDQRHAGS